MDRRAERLAENVPAGNLDRRDNRAVDVPAIERDAVEEALGKRADTARVLADDQMLELAHTGFGSADEAVERPLADAVEAFVGENLDEQPVLPAGADGVGLDPGDTHRSLRGQPAIVSIMRSVESP